MKNNLNCFKFLSSLYKEGELSFYCNTKEEYYEWKEKVLAELSQILGLNKLSIGSLQSKSISVEDLGSFTREKIIINTMDNLNLCLYKLVPKKNPNNVPVLAIHGHGSDGKNVLVGILKEDMVMAYKRFSYTYALDLVKKGYTVFVPDLLGHGDRRFNDSFNYVECTDINNVCISLGISLLGIHTMEMLALIEWIFKDTTLRLDKFMLVGFSGGAILSFFVSAFCEKIYYTAISGFFHGFKDTMLSSNFCGCNFVPNLWSKLDMGELGALIAPRRMYIETGNQDLLNGTTLMENVYPQLEVTKKAYSIFNSDNLEFKVFDGVHKWYGGCYDSMDELIK